MNKAVFLIAFICISTFYATSQISWNVKAGGNISKMTDRDGDMKSGYQTGVGADYFFTDQWGVQSSLMLTSKGLKNDKLPTYDHTGSIIDNSLKINRIYIELPVMLTHKTYVSDKVTFALGGGGYIAYGIGGKYKLQYENNSDINKKGNSFHGGIPKFDVGIAAGCSFEIHKNYLIGLTCAWGLKPSNGPKNQSYGLNIGYIL